MKREKVLLPVDVRRSKTSLLKLSNCKGNADSGNEIAGDCIFPEEYTVKDHISNTKLEKDDHYYIQTRHKNLFSHYNLILRKLKENMSRKAPENTNKMCSCPLGIL